jgi:hypothetical protein
MTIKPLTYYCSFPVPEAVIKEIESASFYDRCQIISTLSRIASLKSTKEFGAVKYCYSLSSLKKYPECKVFAQMNNWLDIIDLASAIAMHTKDTAIQINNTKVNK